MYKISNTSFFFLGVFFSVSITSALLPQVVFPSRPIRQPTLLSLFNKDIVVVVVVVGLPPSLNIMLLALDDPSLCCLTYASTEGSHYKNALCVAVQGELPERVSSEIQQGVVVVVVVVYVHSTTTFTHSSSNSHHGAPCLDIQMKSKLFCDDGSSGKILQLQTCQSLQEREKRCLCLSHIFLQPLVHHSPHHPMPPHQTCCFMFFSENFFEALLLLSSCLSSTADLVVDGWLHIAVQQLLTIPSML